jgi:protein TonB
MHQTKRNNTMARTLLTRTLLALSVVGLSWLSGCSTPAPPPVKPPPRPVITPLPPPPIATPPTYEVIPERPAPQSGFRSTARTARDYRKDAASHLYARNSQQIFKGRLPPLLEAVGVLNVDIDHRGWVKSVQWMRAPRHVPKVMQQIEQMVKAAAPYPVPEQMGQVTYTDVWLWHKSGKFQLDTLTEGQD